MGSCLNVIEEATPVCPSIILFRSDAAVEGETPACSTGLKASFGPPSPYANQIPLHEVASAEISRLKSFDYRHMRSPSPRLRQHQLSCQASVCAHDNQLWCRSVLRCVYDATHWAVDPPWYRAARSTSPPLDPGLSRVISLKRFDLKCFNGIKEDQCSKEEIRAGGDRREAIADQCADLVGCEHGLCELGPRLNS